MFQTTKFTQNLGQKQKHVHMKMKQSFNKNKFTTEETNDKQMHSSGYFSLVV